MAEKPLHTAEPIPQWDPEKKHFLCDWTKDYAQFTAEYLEPEEPLFSSEKEQERVRNLVQQGVQDAVVIELANAGRLAPGALSGVICRMKPKAFIGVDLYNPGFRSQGPNPIRNILPSNSRELEGVPCAQIHSDIFRFLAHVPDNSVSISINGLDSPVLRSDTYEFLLKEIERVCKPGGIVFGNGVQCLSGLKTNPHFIDHIPEANEHSRIELYQKKLKPDLVKSVTQEVRKKVQKKLK